MKRLRAQAVFLLPLCGLFAAAQFPQPKAPPSILVNVLDQDGNGVRDLNKDKFRVKINGRLAPLLAADYSLAPRRIVVLLDMSGSMAGEASQNKKWLIARSALEEFLSETSPQVQVALVTFSSRTHEIFDFSQGRSSIAAWLKSGAAQRSNVKGTTAFYDAMVAAAKLMEPSRPGDAIYALTDGGDNSSNAPRDAAKTILLSSRIRLFLFLFAETKARDAEQVRDIVGLAYESGGFVFGVTGRNSLPAASHSDFSYEYGDKTLKQIELYTRALNTQVNGFYTLQLVSPVSAKKWNKISLEVLDDTGKVNKRVAWTYEQGFPD